MMLCQAENTNTDRCVQITSCRLRRHNATFSFSYTDFVKDSFQSKKFDGATSASLAYDKYGLENGIDLNMTIFLPKRS